MNSSLGQSLGHDSSEGQNETAQEKVSGRPTVPHSAHLFVSKLWIEHDRKGRIQLRIGNDSYG